MIAVFGFSLTSVLLLLCLVIAFCWWIQLRRSPGIVVPRVPAIPVLGSLPWVGSLQEFSEHVGKSLYGLSYKYGPVFYFRLIGIDMVVVNGYESVREVLVVKGSDFAGRPEEFQLLKKHQNSLGILDGDYNNQWKEQRRFSLQNLKVFGFGKRRFEGNIIKEISCLVQELRNKNCQPFAINHLFAVCTSNVICSMAFGERFDYNDQTFKYLLDALMRYFDTRAQPPISELQSYLRWMPSARNYRKKVIKYSNQLLDFCQSRIDEHIQTFNKDNLRDFVDGYLAEINTTSSKSYSVEQLKRILFEIFVGGTETTSTFLQWSMIYMANNPAVQDKVKAELDAVFGTGMSSLQERHRLPYTEATLLELQRISSVLTLTPFHKALKDTEVGGVPVPANTMVAVNLYSVLYDPALFPDPEEFRPERFLTSDFRFERNERVIPFGLGSRMCLGQQLAKQEIFLIFTNVLHQFRITPPPGVDKISTKGHTRITFLPKPFKICAKPYH